MALAGRWAAEEEEEQGSRMAGKWLSAGEEATGKWLRAEEEWASRVVALLTRERS